VANDLNQVCGGLATISYTYGSFHGSISFYIVGYNTGNNGANPSVSTVQAALSAYAWTTPQPLYLFQLVNQESQYHQFNLPGGNQFKPNWGPPLGFGLMQVDLLFWPDSCQSVIFDWTQNVMKGSDILQDDINDAKNFWLTQQANFAAYNQGALTNSAPLNPQLPPPTDIVEGNNPGPGCTFSYSYLNEPGTHSFSDAIAMKYYNAGEGDPYLQFFLPYPQGSFNGHWVLHEEGGNGTDYPALVCNKTTGN